MNDMMKKAKMDSLDEIIEMMDERGLDRLKPKPKADPMMEEAAAMEGQGEGEMPAEMPEGIDPEMLMKLMEHYKSMG